MFTQLSDCGEINPMFINPKTRKLQRPKVQSYFKGDYYITVPGEKEKNGIVTKAESIVFEVDWNKNYMNITNIETAKTRKVESDIHVKNYHSVMKYYFRDGESYDDYCYFLLCKNQQGDFIDAKFLKLSKYINRLKRVTERAELAKIIDKVCQVRKGLIMENFLIGDKIVVRSQDGYLILKICSK